MAKAAERRAMREATKTESGESHPLPVDGNACSGLLQLLLAASFSTVHQVDNNSGDIDSKYYHSADICENIIHFSGRISFLTNSLINLHLIRSYLNYLRYYVLYRKTYEKSAK